MHIKSFSGLILVCSIAAIVSVPLAGCGGSNMEPEGPELGALEKYLNENPELLDTADEEMDMIEGDEFAAAEEGE